MLELGQVDRASDRAVFRQVADMLREKIQRGELQPGDRLPSEAELADHFEVTRMTIRNSIQDLKNEGLVISEHGRGVFVRSAPPVRRLASDRLARAHRERGKAAFLAEAEQAGHVPAVDQIQVGSVPASAEVARRLAIGEGTQVVRRSRRYLANGRPVEQAISYIPADIADSTAIEHPNTGPGGIYARIEETGHTLSHFTEEVSARMPSPDERRTLDMSPGVPVITLVRTAFDTDGRPVEVCDTIKIAHAYVLEYRVPAK